jgi:hypothetical protein
MAAATCIAYFRYATGLHMSPHTVSNCDSATLKDPVRPKWVANRLPGQTAVAVLSKGLTRLKKILTTATKLGLGRPERPWY